MPEPHYLDTPQGRRLAYHRTEGAGPTVVFLGGLRSDMEGTKALHLEAWARREGRAFLRFDYSGHGQSSGRFEEGCIGDWAEDTTAVLGTLVEGKLVLVGSSMGGWQALLAARAAPERLSGLVTIAAAPDFTEDGMWADFTEAQRSEVMDQGRTALPCPTRMLQGTDDADVDMSVALRLLAHAEGVDIRLTLVKGADHRFSSPDCLDLITAAIEQVSG